MHFTKLFHRVSAGLGKDNLVAPSADRIESAVCSTQDVDNVVGADVASGPARARSYDSWPIQADV